MGQLQYIWAGASLADANGVKEDFFAGLAAALGVPRAQLQVGKNFTGHRVGREAQNVNGSTTVKFSNLANGASQFPQDEHGLVWGFRIQEGIDAVVAKTPWVPGVSNVDLLNTTFDLVNNGERIYREIPLDWFPQSVEQNDSGIFMLPSAFYWLAQTDVEITLNLPVNVAVINTNLAIELFGPGLVS